MYAVVVNEGPVMAEDNAVLFTNAHPVCKAVPFVADDEERTTKFVMFVEFTPTNGPRKGKTMRVPLERVVSISNDA